MRKKSGPSVNIKMWWMSPWRVYVRNYKGVEVLICRETVETKKVRWNETPVFRGSVLLVVLKWNTPRDGIIGLLGTFRFSKWNKRNIFIMFPHSKPKHNGLHIRPLGGSSVNPLQLISKPSRGFQKRSRGNQLSSSPFLSHVGQPRLLPKPTRRGAMGRYKNTD